jgi:hypothetical protein
MTRSQRVGVGVLRRELPRVDDDHLQCASDVSSGTDRALKQQCSA